MEPHSGDSTPSSEFRIVSRRKSLKVRLGVPDDLLPSPKTPQFARKQPLQLTPTPKGATLQPSPAKAFFQTDFSQVCVRDI